MTEYKDMTEQELEILSQQLEVERVGIKEKMMAVAKELDQRATYKSAKGKLAVMSDAEKTAMVSLLGLGE